MRISNLQDPAEPLPEAGKLLIPLIQNAFADPMPLLLSVFPDINVFSAPPHHSISAAAWFNHIYASHALVFELVAQYFAGVRLKTPDHLSTPRACLLDLMLRYFERAMRGFQYLYFLHTMFFFQLFSVELIVYRLTVCACFVFRGIAFFSWKRQYKKQCFKFTLSLSRSVGSDSTKSSVLSLL